MSPLYCAAVDLGATSGRVIVGTWSDHQLTTTEVHRFPNAIFSLGQHDYWNITSLWAEVRTGLTKAAASLPKGATLSSVGVDTWGVDHALLNDEGRLVFPTHAYRDARTQAGLNSLLNTRAALARIYAATGIPAVFFNSSFQLAETVASNPAITDLATRCLFLPDYFNYLLSGKMTNGFAIASTTQLLDVHGDDWSREALDYFRVPPTWLTKPVKTGSKLGRVKGLPELAKTTVVAVPGHDTTCAYDAMPAAPEGGDIFLSSGTWSLVGFENDAPILGPEALAARVANDRTGRGEYRPLVNVIGLWLLERTLDAFPSRPTKDREWRALIKAAATLPAPKCLIDVADPAFANPKSMKAAIDAHLKARKAKPPRELAGYMRLICDSLGQGHADVIQRFQEFSGKTFHRVLMVGGGAKNRLLCQATANASGLPVHAFQLEGSAIGNLANQLIALKAVKNLAAFRASLSQQLKPTVYTPAG
ncbi:rhamnulokinase [Actomonas aquatica]|uniref:FGGY family carbohydrate kinase n=1 Tax=Actomonas aquatica TaxID=2866162 RepID=A0ABZ1C7M6_9BACT|nr:FGGY-family carbohydrate kinase [Opitutus sp. WL0086]WRQ87640.1 FGGY family carbohydrate kinase [Opitutus sp. WL0086]